ncbi:chorismate mutase [Lactococcus termiticola]|uniref:Chorismate mutase n=1 Tax=Lactococcus termiticola TaxID=2169526 RepID=A0A2R5HHG8_9LACT|nr:chorismate mutase [Lactococcus termiticola]GBG97296.1 chorismate mutase [Lactococcus termiticola]
MNLEDYRNEIDRIDGELLSLLEERMRAVSGIVQIKKEAGLAILDKDREKAVFEKLEKQLGDSDFKDSILRTFEDILKQSRQYQEAKLEN